jgi:hypothetical protein
MNRVSQAVPVVPADPYDAMPSPRPAPLQVVPATVNRVATIEPGVGKFRLVYRDEYGTPLLEWDCDYRVGDEDRQWLRKVQQAAGDQLPAAGGRLPGFRPRLLR